jgi:hypothetical protein
MSNKISITRLIEVMRKYDDITYELEDQQYFLRRRNGAHLSVDTVEKMVRPAYDEAGCFTQDGKWVQVHWK